MTDADTARARAPAATPAPADRAWSPPPMAALLGLLGLAQGRSWETIHEGLPGLGSVRHPARGELLDDGRAESAQVVR